MHRVAHRIARKRRDHQEQLSSHDNGAWDPAPDGSMAGDEELAGSVSAGDIVRELSETLNADRQALHDANEALHDATEALDAANATYEALDDFMGRFQPPDGSTPERGATEVD